eukprot:5456650-Prymnesium_polylepis.1
MLSVASLSEAYLADLSPGGAFFACLPPWPPCRAEDACFGAFFGGALGGGSSSSSTADIVTGTPARRLPADMTTQHSAATTRRAMPCFHLGSPENLVYTECSFTRTVSISGSLDAGRPIA